MGRLEGQDGAGGRCGGGIGGGGAALLAREGAAVVCVRDRTAYLASNGRARSRTIGMALDLAPYAVLGNALAPGPTLTPLTRDRFADEEVRAWTRSRIPLGRFDERSDLAGATVFLASDEARWVTGTTIVADGGYLAE